MMPLLHAYLFPAIWLSYAGYWWAMSRNVKETERTEPAPSQFARVALLVIAAALLWAPRVPGAVLNKRFFPGFLADSEWGFWTGAVVTASGLLFSVWARRHLGTNWSQAVTVKKDHELIRSGPYRFVRHPIYSGLLLGFVGSAIARGEWRGVMAVVLVFGALWSKLRLEGKWMRSQFGEPYEVYSQKVAALVPHIL